MKHTILVAAVATLGASAAFAQSSVTVYGRLNTTIERQKIGSGAGSFNRTEMVNNASRIGFRGTEDLGGGLKAGFQIEHGFNSDTGAQTQTAFWARQSEVNIGGDRVGLLRLGNYTSEAYYATADYVSMHNHDTGTSSDAFYAYLGRNRDKVSYRTPSFGGATVEVGAQLRDVPGDVNRIYEAALNFTRGPLHLGAGYEKDGSNRNQYAVRALYAFGPFLLGGYVQRDENGLGPTLGKRTTTRLAGAYNVGNTELHLNWGHAGKYSNVANSKANQFTVGINYNLSKRTKVYTFWTQINDGAANIYGDFRSVAVGVRHNF